MYLDQATFYTVVAATPLVSIDLLVRNEKDKVLLGMRKNRPAQKYWFVPGGRILKGELLDDAFRRITREELGYRFERSDARFLGLFEHHYADSIFGNDPSTHYVALGHEIKFHALRDGLPDSQHERYEWFSLEDASELPDIHPYTQRYIEYLYKESVRADC